MDQKILILLICTLFITSVTTITSDATFTPVSTITPVATFTPVTTITPVATITHQVFTTLPPFCSNTLDCEFLQIGPPGKKLVKIEVVQVAIVDYDDHSSDMLRDIELCHKYYNKLSLKAAVQMDLNRTIQQGTNHDALEDALATMELFRVNRNFWDEMIPTRDFRLTRTILAPCPTTPPVPLPPPDDYVALNLMSARFGSGKKKEFFPLQVTLVDYWYNIVLNEYILQNITDLQTNSTGVKRDIYEAQARNFTDVHRSLIDKTEGKIIIAYNVFPFIRLLKINDHEIQKLRELQRSPPIRFNPEYRKSSPRFDIIVAEELNTSIIDHGLPSSALIAKAEMLLYQKFRDSD
ncbi:10449_t:CDS:2 [Gigaspora margarita]|uniref:10449_t:CDS:1 n=1 Tax=Gigaspora margarita TaxID=4874 RepID=A0ABN7ULP0_GIGMA|nr:10449_t:CDS:2 [Gigaspora margarita]